MNELETKIINKIKDMQVNNAAWDKYMQLTEAEKDPRVRRKLTKTERLINKDIAALFDQLIAARVCSDDFIASKDLEQYISSCPYDRARFWVRTQYIIHSKDDVNVKLLEELDGVFKNIMQLNMQAAISDPEIAIAIYSSNNDKLIAVHQKYFSTPNAELFRSRNLTVPEAILKKERESKRVIQTFFKHSPISKMEEVTRSVQRVYRAKKRKKEELKRIKQLYEQEIKTSGKSVEVLMQEANTAYLPKGCDKKLAERIFNAAKEVVLFSEIRHVTDPAAIKSIINTGLYGRSTLEKFNMQYKPSALGITDIIDGDRNVICFGPFDIDPGVLTKTKLNMQIILDVEKMQQKNPTIFFKQRDFGYDKSEERRVMCGTEWINFCHTHNRDWSPTMSVKFRPSDIHFELATKYGTGYASLPKFQFIAYDFAHIHQILTLNFFKLLDQINSETVRNAVYAEIAKLSDKELEVFLMNVGMELTDTSEFNFYGAHQLDLSSVLKIKVPSYELHMPTFIDILNVGNMAELNKARQSIPLLFESYRFLDYLLTQVHHTGMRTTLEEMRAKCEVPIWMDEKHPADEKSLSSESKSISKR